MSKKNLIVLLVVVGVVAFFAGNYFTPFAFRYSQGAAKSAMGCVDDVSKGCQEDLAACLQDKTGNDPGNYCFGMAGRDDFSYTRCMDEGIKGCSWWLH